MRQTKAQSRRETFWNLVVGISLALVVNYTLIKYPLFESPANQAWWITLWFTLLSMLRQYYMRRFFNWFDHRPRQHLHE